MKKLTLAIISLAFLVGGVSFVNAKDIARNDAKKAIEEMDKLVEKYNKASDKQKPAIEKEIKEKVAANYDEHLKFAEERTAELEKRVTEAKAKLEEMKTYDGKTKHVDEITKKIISGEKPMLFRPPFKDGKNFRGHRHHGMKGRWYKGRRGAKGECICAKGDMLPPPPPPAEQPAK